MKTITLELVDFDLIKLKFPDYLHGEIKNNLNLEGDYSEFMKHSNFLKTLSNLKEKFPSIEIKSEYQYIAVSPFEFIGWELPALIVNNRSIGGSISIMSMAIGREGVPDWYDLDIYDDAFNLFPKDVDILENLRKFRSRQYMIYDSLMTGGCFNDFGDDGWYMKFLELRHED